MQEILSSWKNWEKERKSQFWEYLGQYITDERKEKFENILRKRTKHLTVVIEDLFQQHNAGAILRTCEGLGIQEVHVIEKNYEFKILNSIAKSSEKWLDIYRYQEQGAEKCLQNLKSKGYKIVATSPHTETSIQQWDITQKTAFVLGAEKVGISEVVAQNADAFVKIPMAGFVESFNVSVAAAVLLYETTQRLHRETSFRWQLSEEEHLEKRIDWALKSVRRAAALMRYFLEYYEKK